MVAAKSSVYVVAGGSRHIKIGISIDVQERVKGIQTGCPHKVRLVKSWKALNAIKIERAAHRLLGKWRAEGEWFDLPERVAIIVITALVRQQARDDQEQAFPRQESAILFCGNCRHSGQLQFIPAFESKFRCTNCKQADRVHCVELRI